VLVLLRWVGLEEVAVDQQGVLILCHLHHSHQGVLPGVVDWCNIRGML